MNPLPRKYFFPALLCVTAALLAGPPAWWSERGVIAEDTNGDPLPSNNYAVANIGQAKNLAQHAYEEMKSLGFIDLALPTGSAANDLLVQQWNSPATGTQNYAAINQGQLKNLAKPFYDRLAEFGYSGPPLEPGETYPWGSSVGPTQHHALVNLGQLKHVFSFRVPGGSGDAVDTDEDGLPDTWELSTYGSLSYKDVTAPSVPGQPVVEARTQTSITLSWVGSTDNYAVAAYELNVGATLVATILPPTTSYNLTGLSPSTAYEIVLRAKDTAGNASAYTDPISVSTIGYETPDAVSGLRLWLRADSEAAGELDVWHDQSGNNNDVAAAAADARPTVVSGMLNGHAVVRFDGVDDELVLPDVLDGKVQGEVYIVNRLRDWAKDYYGLCLFGSNGSGAAYNYDVTEDDVVFTYDGFGLDDSVEFPAMDSRVFTRPHVYNASIGPDAFSITRLDGRVASSLQGTEVAFTHSPKLGTDSGDGSWDGFFPGDIAEVVVYDHVLTPAERQMLHRYFNDKYVLPGIVIPPAPVLVAKATGTTTADLTWAPLNGIDQYLAAVLERKTGASPFAIVATIESSSLSGLANSFSYTDTGLSPGTTYSYRVRFDSYVGTGAYSQTVEASTPISAAAPATDDLRLWLRSTAGTPVTGPISLWADQSGANNHATWDPIIHSSQRPELVPDAFNGYPVVRFNADPGQFLYLSNVMNGASAGEAFVVLRRNFSESFPFASLWAFRNTDGESEYPNALGIIDDDFARGGSGTRQMAPNLPPASALGGFHLYNVGGDESSWFQKLNRNLYSSAPNENVSFFAYPRLGWGSTYFHGDIAEILIYNRLLTPTERASTENYLTSKYGLDNDMSGDNLNPTAPASLDFTLGTPYQTTLVWPASTDNVGVVAYDIYKDGVQIASIQGLAFTAVGLDPSTSYEFKVRARDAAGNVSSFRYGSALVTPPAVTSDSDQDGMSDAWETAHGLNPNSAGDANGDVDGDGVSNLSEFEHASNPGLQTVDDTTNSQHLRVIWP